LLISTVADGSLAENIFKFMGRKPILYTQGEGRFVMEISSVASQALSLKEQMNTTQMGLAAVKQAAEAEQKMADMLARNSETVQAAANAEPGQFSTYA
jgi:hypothetical protein